MSVAFDSMLFLSKSPTKNNKVILNVIKWEN